ncbi:LytR C-terminal domain-containing protein [Arthrobacter sp. RIT-PI-e]|uniref:LytR C-terminal domain-containing protein n=1 Tax=Arthrobacter sp. RIT-PI-e TaxID=1681197 RepID=UPI0006767F70|nr:LytR C-terminal domain-containing protein [Arthrobacter sp. RIT-PI-e]
MPVLVVNATTDPERAAEVQEILATAGYTQTSPYPSAPVETTQVVFGGGYASAAEDLASRLGVQDSQVFENTEVIGLQLLIGADLSTGDRVVVPPLGTDLRGQTADQVTCQAASPF